MMSILRILINRRPKPRFKPDYRGYSAYKRELEEMALPYKEHEKMVKEGAKRFGI